MALTGKETLQVLGQDANGQPAATTEQTTTGAIAALASSDTSFVATPITTVGNGILTAAGLVGGEIVRSGPVAAFTDTTDTAANIASQPGVIVGGSVSTLIKNATAFPMTLSAGVGVTLPLTVLIPPFTVANYVMNIVSATAVTWLHVDTTPIAIGQNLTAPSATALSTVGAGTILATGFASGTTARSGAQVSTAFTDTTDTAANIIAACANLVNKIGTSFVYRYVNNTNAPATIQGGTGVTVSGVTVVPANSWAEFLVSYTAAATLTMVGVGQGYFPSSGAFVSNGVTPVTVANAAVTAGSSIIITLKTASTPGASPPAVATITPGTGFTVKGLTSDISTYNYTILG